MIFDPARLAGSLQFFRNLVRDFAQRAFSQEPEAVRPIWNDHDLLFDTVLQHVGRNYIPEPGEQMGWHKLRATIEVPTGTRSVVISLGAGNDEPGATDSDHFVDAVQSHEGQDCILSFFVSSCLCVRSKHQNRHYATQ